MTQKVTSNSITSVDVSKLSGNHTNATYGQNLTGINDGIIESASDPTASSNPAGGLGTLWVNYTSGEMYNLTNASTNSNYWTNVGGKSGDIFYSYTGADGQIGTQYGYCGFGEDFTQKIERFSFASSANGSNFSNVTTTSGYSRTSTTSSTTHGYACGFVTYNTASSHSEMSKFAFSNGTYYKNVDNLAYAPVAPDGCQSPTHGFTVAGQGVSRIDKYSFATDQESGTWANIQGNYGYVSASNSDTHGYWSGGAWPEQSYIGRFAFATQNNTAGVGSLSPTRWTHTSVNNTTHTYFFSGNPANVDSGEIWKFAFASSVTVSQHGYLYGNSFTGYPAGCSETTHGYVMGGNQYSGASTRISRFAWSSNSTAAQVGTLVNFRYWMEGWQK